MKKILLFFIALSLLCCTCRKKDKPVTPPPPSLPRATQTGANTFGCLVNGEVWLPKGGGFVQTIERDVHLPVISILANKAKESEAIKLNLTNVYSTGNYILSPTIKTQVVFYNIVSDWYYCDSIVPGNLTFMKIDTANKIISGTFFFDAVKGNTRYQIRDGRFDLKYS